MLCNDEINYSWNNMKIFGITFTTTYVMCGMPCGIFTVANIVVSMFTFTPARILF